MYDYAAAVLVDRLNDVLVALNRIPRRFCGIESPQDFSHNEEGRDRLDAICMTLVAAGEAFRRIDKKTDGRFLADYPEIDC